MSLTLKDIAKMVGVAESTVSRAINNKPGVGEETKKRIMEVVADYNFKPNQLAQGLAKKETHILALLLSELLTHNYLEIIKNVEELANQAGYQVILCNTANDIKKEENYLELVRDNRVDGVIIVGGELADKNILNLAFKRNGRMVLVNRMAEQLLIPTILVDSSKGGYLATKHLLDQGIERIAIIMGSREEFLEGEKLAGYQQALREKNIPLKDELIIETDSTRKSGYNAFLKLMELTDLPQGFFVTGEFLAVGLVEAIKTGGYLIPDDFCLIGYGDSIITSLINPPLTVVAEPLAQIGKLAVEYLINLINSTIPEEIIKVLEPKLIIRDTSIPYNK